MIVSVRSDVVIVGRDDEDGSPIEALCFYVIGEAPNGHRIAHDTSWCNRGATGRDEDGFRRWPRDNGEAERKAERLAAKVRQHLAGGGSLDATRWREIDPCYGSDAYQALDNEYYFRTREITAAHDRGEISETEALRLNTL
jgi:hypothetical protein